MTTTDVDLDQIADAAITCALHCDSDAVTTLLRPLPAVQTRRLALRLTARAADTIIGWAADLGHTEQEALTLWQQARLNNQLAPHHPPDTELDNTADAAITCALHQDDAIIPLLHPLTPTDAHHLCKLLATRNAEALNGWGADCGLTEAEIRTLWENARLRTQLEQDN